MSPISYFRRQIFTDVQKNTLVRYRWAKKYIEKPVDYFPWAVVTVARIQKGERQKWVVHCGINGLWAMAPIVGDTIELCFMSSALSRGSELCWRSRLANSIYYMVPMNACYFWGSSDCYHSTCGYSHHLWQHFILTSFCNIISTAQLSVDINNAPSVFCK